MARACLLVPNARGIMLSTYWKEIFQTLSSPLARNQVLEESLAASYPTLAKLAYEIALLKKALLIHAPVSFATNFSFSVRNQGLPPLFLTH